MTSEKVMIPSPPSWMSPRMTAWPKGVKPVPVSRTTRPVTHTALVAVNRASTNPTGWPAGVAAGRRSRPVPTAMRAAKLPTRSRKGRVSLAFMGGGPSRTPRICPEAVLGSRNLPRTESFGGFALLGAERTPDEPRRNRVGETPAAEPSGGARDPAGLESRASCQETREPSTGRAPGNELAWTTGSGCGPPEPSSPRRGRCSRPAASHSRRAAATARRVQLPVGLVERVRRRPRSVPALKMTGGGTARRRRCLRRWVRRSGSRSSPSPSLPCGGWEATSERGAGPGHEPG